MTGDEREGWGDAGDAMSEPSRVPPGGFRDRIRRKPGIGQAYRIGVFVVGVAFILLGFALVVLPGPLTIPPILLGLLILASEFAWAQKLLDRAKDKASEAWQQAKEHPISSAVVTGSGLVGVAVVVWAYFHYDLRDKLPF